MKRQLLVLLALTAVMICAPMKSASAVGGHGGGHRGGHGHGRGFGLGFGFFEDDDGLAELYRELLRNVPYYALHPPVYYSYPVPRPYGWSPFADPFGVIPPDVLGHVQPLEIVNPYVPSSKSEPAEKKTDTTAAVSKRPEPLVIINPFVAPDKSLVRSEQ